MSTQLFHGHCEVCIEGKVEDLRTDKRMGVKKRKKRQKLVWHNIWRPSQLNQGWHFLLAESSSGYTISFKINTSKIKTASEATNHGLQQRYGWSWPVRSAHSALLHPQKHCSLVEDHLAALPGHCKNKCLHFAPWDEQCQAGAPHDTQRLGVSALWHGQDQPVFLGAGELITFLCPLSQP